MSERRVDHNAIRTNQVFTISLLALAFVLDWPALAGFVAAILLISAVLPPLGLFTRVYRHILRPGRLVKPDVHLDNPEPHRFAQFLGSIMVGVGVAVLLAGYQFGWVFAGIVIALASLNLFAGICVGCLLYYWLNRLGIPGFKHNRIEAAR